MDDRNLQLGDSKDVLELTSADAIIEQLATMIDQCRRRVLIFSHDLEPRIYDCERIDAALASAITRSQRVEVQILVQNIDAVVKADHYLVKLMRRLSSYVEIRKTAPQHRHRDLAFALIDDCGYLQRSPGDGRSYDCCYNDRLTVRDLAEDFKLMWQYSLRASELMRLYF